MRKFWIFLAITALVLSQLACGASEPDALPVSTPGAGVVELPSAAPNQPEQAPANPPQAAPDSNLPAWTIMLYLDADDDVLEDDIIFDLNETELVGSTDQVQIIAQLDRFNGSFDGDGDWTGARRYYITQDSDLGALGSPLVEDLGEVDMGDPQTLVDFIAWASVKYPAQKYGLVLSDHGSGWLGGWTDPDPVEGSQLYLVEISQALQAIQQGTAIDRFEFIGFDACLMSQVEVYAAVQPYARFAVASQEVEPALGWAYQSWLSQLTTNPSMNGGQLGKAIVDSYIVEDQLVVNDQARLAAFGNKEASAILRDLGSDITLSAVNLDQFVVLMQALDSLAATMVDLDQATVAKARTYAQPFTTVFEGSDPSPYIDLGHFAQLIYDLTGDPAAGQALAQLRSAMQSSLIAEKHGTARPGSSGFTIHFPISRQYTNPDYGAEIYPLVADHFAAASHWDEFLAYHYTGTPFAPVEGQAFQPPSNATISAPGAAQIDLLPVEISTDRITSGQSVFLTSQVQGTNIAYVYTFVGYLEAETNAVLVADMDFYFTEDTREANGVYYPYFGEGEPFPLEWEWSGNIFNMNDGEISSFALFEPESYGAPDEAASYAVYGTYTYANGNPPDSAVIYFADFGDGGQAYQAYAFTGANGNGAPWEINPQTGDQFTVQYTIYTQDENGQILYNYSEGDTFTIGEPGLYWEAIPAPPGTYVVGFIVIDFDGNAYYQVAPILVE